MGDRLNKLVREEIHLVWNEGDKFQPFNQAFHLVFPENLDAERFPEQFIEPMGTTSGRDDLHALPHFFNRDAIDGRRALYELLNKFDAIINGVRLEALKVQRATRKVLQRYAA